MSSQSQQGDGLPSQSSSSEPAVRSHWRECQDLSEFARLCGLDGKQTSFLEIQYRLTCSDLLQSNVTAAILCIASECLNRIRLHFGSGGIFGNLPYPVTEGNEEDAISIYMETVRIDTLCQTVTLEQFRPFLQQRLANIRTDPIISSSREAIISAFHQDQRSDRDITAPIYDQICQLHQDFDPLLHNSPYTALVGPSGIGKSFIVEQIARQNYAYVAYLSLDRDGSMAYPPPSLIAREFYGFTNRNDMTNFCESYIAATGAHVELCRELEITPTAFFDLQVLPKFSEIQASLKDRINALYQQVRTRNPKDPDVLDRVRSGGRKNFGNQEYLDPFMDDYKEQTKPTFLAARRLLVGSPRSNQYLSTTNPPTNTTVPESILCFDEARGLLEKVGSEEAMRFLSLRRAIRHQSISFAEPNKRYFALFLDTTSRVANSTPPKYQDRSLKIVQENAGLLFEPIYRLDGMDVFALGKSDVIRSPERLIAANNDDVARSLFTFGRPLWGALMKTGGLDAVINLAFSKVAGASKNPDVSSEVPRHLAIASYRVNFPVTEPSLADTLTSRHLRFLTRISEDRSILKTSQPSEPILAHTSAILTLRGETRLDVVRALYDHLVQGTIDVGDIGEMVASLIFLYAFDKMHEQPAGSIRTPYQSPKPLAEYVMTLFPEDNCTDIRFRVDDNVEMHNYWRKGHVFVSHFVRLTEKPDENTLRRAFCRGAAMFTPVGYPGCDIIIPIGLSDSSMMSYLLVQVKNRKYDSMTSGLRQEARNSLKMAADYLPDRAHIGMMMALRRKGHSQFPPLSHKKRKSETLRFFIAEPGDSERNTRSRTESRWNWSRIPRLVLLSLGADLTTYPGLGFRRGNEADQYDDQVVEVLNALLSCTADGFPEKQIDAFYRHLLPLDYAQ